MRRPASHLPEDLRPSPRRLACLLLIFLVVGCQTPAAHVAPTAPDDPFCCRAVLLARQVATDTALEITCHPGRVAANLAVEPVSHLRAAGAGIAGKRIAMNCRAHPGPVAGEFVGGCSPFLPDSFCQGKHELRPAQVELYLDGLEALQALERLIAGATQQIDVLMFQWENDKLGAMIAGWLTARAAPGLRVRVLVDGGGNLIFGEPEKARADVNGVVYALSRAAHVEVLRTRNPFGRFDHRKLVVVDGRCAWTGGRNFTRQSFFDQHDVSFTVTGPLVTQMQETFEEFWQDQGGEPGVVPSADGPAGANAWGRLVHTAPARHDLARAVYRAVDRARHHVYAENLFLFDSVLIRKLVKARGRGVDVRVVLATHTDNRVADGANRVIANRLVEAGVRVYLYPGLTHVKAAAVDGCWAYLGTANLDAVSLRHNHELGVVLAAGPAIQEVETRLFAVDFHPEWELKSPRPLSFRDYYHEVLASLFH